MVFFDCFTIDLSAFALPKSGGRRPPLKKGGGVDFFFLLEGEPGFEIVTQLADTRKTAIFTSIVFDACCSLPLHSE
jgi:hypothetical protein